MIIKINNLSKTMVFSNFFIGSKPGPTHESCSSNWSNNYSAAWIWSWRRSWVWSSSRSSNWSRDI